MEAIFQQLMMDMSGQEINGIPISLTRMAIEREHADLKSQGAQLNQYGMINTQGDPVAADWRGNSSIASLVEMDLKDTLVNIKQKVSKRYEQRYVRSKMTLSANKLAAVTLFLQSQRDPEMHLRFLVYNLVDATCTDRGLVERLFPLGLEIAVKEPYLKFGSTDAGASFRLDDPSHLAVFWRPFDRAFPRALSQAVQLLAQRGVEVVSEGPEPDPALPAEDLKTEGNRLLKEGLTLQAAYYYRASALREPSVAAWSNLSQALLDLDDPLGALHAAEKALSMDAQHTKSEVRKGRALQAMSQFEQAAACFRRCQEDKALAAQVKPMLADVEKRARFATSGAGPGVPMSEIVLPVSEVGKVDRLSKSGPPCDFVGPVELKPSPKGGLGLFASRDIKEGEILAVNRAISYSKTPKGIAGMRMNNHTKTIDKISTLDNEGKMLRLLRTNPAVARLLSRLHGVKSPNRSAPSESQLTAASFTLQGSWREVLQGPMLPPYTRSVSGPPLAPLLTAPDARLFAMSTADVMKILNLNGFSDDTSFMASVKSLGDNSMLQSLGSLFNHSCCPNASHAVSLGPSQVIFANRDIPKDAEVFISYRNGYSVCPLFAAFEEALNSKERTLSTPLKPVTSFMRKWGFDCDCDFCSLINRARAESDEYRAFDNRMDLQGRSLVESCASETVYGSLTAPASTARHRAAITEAARNLQGHISEGQAAVASAAAVLGIGAEDTRSRLFLSYHVIGLILIRTRLLEQLPLQDNVPEILKGTEQVVDFYCAIEPGCMLLPHMCRNMATEAEACLQGGGGQRYGVARAEAERLRAKAKAFIAKEGKIFFAKESN